jgi:hypothetical protein
MKSYKLTWNDGHTEIIKGASIDDAFMRAGYGGGALRSLDHWEEVKNE